MDIDLFRDEEQFSTFDTHNFMDHYPDDSTSLDDLHNFSQNEMYEWNMDSEREINGDIALIPMCDMNVSRLNDSPCKDDFQKIMNDWQQFISIDTGCDEFKIEEPIVMTEENDDELIEQKSSPLHEILDLPNSDNFDITSYINDTETIPSTTVPSEESLEAALARKPRAAVKKIDLKAQRYIVDDDEDEVDVETVSECGENSPVLEAGDLNSLLEQFEATQVPQLALNFIKNDPDLFDSSKKNIPIEPDPIVIKNELVNPLKNLEIKQESNTGTGAVKIKDEPVASGINASSKPDMANVKTECTDLDVGKDKQRKSRNKLKFNSQNEKKVGEIEVKQEVCKAKLDSRPELKDIKIEQAKQTTNKNDLDMRQNPEKFNKPPQPNHKSELTPSLKPPTSKQPTTPQHTNVQQKLTNHKTTESTTSPAPGVDPAKNKQIIDSLPQELIARIKESGKRKTISVIAPIPAKKRGGPRAPDATSPQVTARNKTVVMKRANGAETVQLDHDYCSLATPYPKHPKKDSGFESAEEDDRTIIGKQPTVKNADGKLMVSLLKVNTIHTTTESTQKKKLNLEEYKKRREGFLKSQNNSQNCSPVSSTCSSPLPEDEHTKRLKHQEKLLKMAMEVLNTPPKSEKKSELAPTNTNPPAKPVVKLPPPDMEKKTLVSIGVNTNFKVKRKNLDPLAPVEQLDEIKPLLKKVSDKINCNSLITSVIENIPKIIDSCDRQSHEAKAPSNNKLDHGEDKTIVYLPKNRAAIKTRSVECQTNISLIQQTKASRYRRRRTTSSSSSGSSISSSKSRKSRTSSRYSRRRRRSSNSSRSSSRSSRSSGSRCSSSSYSSRSSTRSRSRSTSPKYLRKEREQKERLREVEERRVIYVGRISSGTTREDLRKRFHKFGPITNVSLHSRDHGYLDNYGFVTFANKLDAYEAIEHGNDDPWQPKYDLSFGGRRIFCQTTYSDLDNMRDEGGYFPHRETEDTFDSLLRDMQEKLRKRKV